MEKLQELLIDYNNTVVESSLPEWAKQYRQIPFPSYWEQVYHALEKEDKASRIIEIGCGAGDVTSICCYLNFVNIMAFESDPCVLRSMTTQNSGRE